MDHKTGKLAKNPKRAICPKTNVLPTRKMESLMMTFLKTHLALGKSEITQKSFAKNPIRMTQIIFLKVLIKILTIFDSNAAIVLKGRVSIYPAYCIFGVCMCYEDDSHLHQNQVHMQVYPIRVELVIQLTKGRDDRTSCRQFIIGV